MTRYESPSSSKLSGAERNIGVGTLGNATPLDSLCIVLPLYPQYSIPMIKAPTLSRRHFQCTRDCNEEGNTNIRIHNR